MAPFQPTTPGYHPKRAAPVMIGRELSLSSLQCVYKQPDMRLFTHLISNRGTHSPQITQQDGQSNHEYFISDDIRRVGRTIQVETFIAASAYLTTLILVQNVVVILSDILAFFGVVRQVWGLWKEKQILSLDTGKDLVTLLLQQDILRFSYATATIIIMFFTKTNFYRSFVLFITVTQIIIDYISPTVGTEIDAFQNSLSVILICELTLNLRRRNTTRPLPNPSALELPDLNLSVQNNPVRSIQSVFGRLQERMIADMEERSDLVDIEGPGQLEGEPEPEIA
ncbi:hypothetical protein Clacol_004626 [Clathrus columnatus]|uniref:Uncharacterized protein n=1 Tax=Clathrus columnatus TaxID=1419009 RepID=A0AAV5ABV4_9AGAM|nr:hypothetical protein Clacol_004626 [Clathrus columnatus]